MMGILGHLGAILEPSWSHLRANMSPKELKQKPVLAYEREARKIVRVSEVLKGCCFHFLCLGALEVFEGILGLLGGIMGALGSILGPSWEVLGGVLGAMLAYVGLFGTMLGASWTLTSGLGGVLGGLGGILGGLGGYLGGYVGLCWAIWEHLNGILGAS